MRKFLSIIPATVVVCGLTGCSNNDPTVMLNGNVVSNSLTAEKLGEGYSVKEDLLYYDGEPVASVMFTEKTADRERNKQEIRSLAIGANSGVENNTLSIDEISLGSNMSEVVDTFGNPKLREAGRWFFSEDGNRWNDTFLEVKFDVNTRKVTWLKVYV